MIQRNIKEGNISCSLMNFQLFVEREHKQKAEIWMIKWEDVERCKLKLKPWKEPL